MAKLHLNHKHLSLYIPYELRCEILNYKSDYVGNRYATCNGYYLLADEVHYTFGERGLAGKTSSLIKPIFRPINEITVENTGLDPTTISAILYVEKMSSLPYNSSDLLLETIQFKHVLMLIEKNFDVFGYIKSGLAINRNNLIK